MKSIKKNKDIKVGDKLYSLNEYLHISDYYIVESVKKKGTLVTVTAAFEDHSGKGTFLLYGHASAATLSGYGRCYHNAFEFYTCDSVIVNAIKRKLESKEKRENVGYHVIELFKKLGIE